jgi:uncharacterized protein YbjT (DUF2867 family)
MSRVVVLGGTGAMGAAVAALLRDRGHDVVAASRATGVDASTGAGLDDALAGADTVVDCLNVVTMSKKAATSFFAAAATHVASAAASAGVGHIVCLSIVNVTDPGVRRATGYYAGKAAQEEAYAAGSVPVTFARTTAWFSLAETFLSQIRVGPVAVIPGMRLQPVHPAAAAAFVADAVESGPPSGSPPSPMAAPAPAASPGLAVRQLAGPDVLDAAAMARAVARTRHPGVRVVRLALPMAGLRGGLLPRGELTVDPRTFDDWLTS